MTRAIAIQSSMTPDMKRPYPYHVVGEGEHLGYVLGQDLWRGDPYALVGFQDRVDEQTVNLRLRDFIADPDRAVGKYPVFSDANTDQFYTEIVAVASVTVYDDPKADAELAKIPQNLDDDEEE